METVYKFTMDIKCETPFWNRNQGSHTQYVSSTVTRICTDSVLDKEIDDFNKAGGKVISIKREIAKKLCTVCHSEVTYNFYDFNHDCCNDCLEKRVEEFNKKIQNAIDTILISNLIKS